MGGERGRGVGKREGGREGAVGWERASGRRERVGWGWLAVDSYPLSIRSEKRSFTHICQILCELVQSKQQETFGSRLNGLLGRMILKQTKNYKILPNQVDCLCSPRYIGTYLIGDGCSPDQATASITSEMLPWQNVAHRMHHKESKLNISIVLPLREERNKGSIFGLER